MTVIRPPALFVSHGSPMLAIEDSPARRFLAALAGDLPRPRAVLVATAHWETRETRVSGALAPETIHDFGGFPSALYEIEYRAPGAPDVAAAAAALLRGAGLPAGIDAHRGMDHGTWVPLSLLFPAADVPVAQVSIQPHRSPEHHWRLGEALRPLRDEGVLVIGSGALTHNLREYFGVSADGTSGDWVAAFADWMAAAVRDRRIEALLDYRRQAPFAERNHPTDEHLLPLFVALGAASPDGEARVLHRSRDRVLAMDAYAFA